MGRYYPPDASNPPSFNQSSHPLGKRANKISSGILTVRFELPFAVWCTHCTPPAIVGQGVRFNAQKKKVGNYYSTPIWQFRMKHSACGGWWEIRTDPKNSEYVVVEGARKRDYGPEDKGDGLAEGDMRFLTEDERSKRREDAFAGLEGKVEERRLEKGGNERVKELMVASEVWRDPYDVNAKLRQGFRAERKVLKREERLKEGMKDKFSLGIDIVNETEGDRARAKMVDFGVGKEEESWTPLFESEVSTPKVALKTKKAKDDALAQKNKQKLQSTLLGNTRAVIDPFRPTNSSSTKQPTFSLLKRKRDPDIDVFSPPLGSSTILDTDTNDRSIAINESSSRAQAAPTPVPSSMALVDYDSD